MNQSLNNMQMNFLCGNKSINKWNFVIIEWLKTKIVSLVRFKNNWLI